MLFIFRNEFGRAVLFTSRAATCNQIFSRAPLSLRAVSLMFDVGNDKTGNVRVT